MFVLGEDYLINIGDKHVYVLILMVFDVVVYVDEL